MAKQNFLAGGYYGKLGVTVGQRWKNIRTIRSYVIPANPRTERQQANRGVFGGATKWSQIGMSMNYNATCFEHEAMSRWNYRMRTCRNLHDDGNIDLQLIPLYPTTFTPPFMITSFEVAERQAGNKVVFTVEGQLPNVDRVLSVMFHLYNSLGVDLGYKLYMGNFKAGASPTVEIIFDNLDELNEYDKVRLVSRDDVDSTTDLIGSPMLDVIDSAPDIRDFNTTIRSISKALDGVTIVFAEPYKNASSTSFVGSVYAVSSGAFEEVQGANLTLHNEGGYFAVTIPCSYTLSQEILAFAPGSEVRITSISAIGARFEYTKSNETLSFSDADLSRTMGGYTLKLDNNVDTIQFIWSMKQVPAVFTTTLAGVLKSSLSPSAVNGISFDLLRVSDAYNNVLITTHDAGYTFAMRSGDWITYPSTSFTVNGVTYNIEGETRKPITNSRIETFITSEHNTPSCTFQHDWDGDEWSAEAYIYPQYFDVSSADTIPVNANCEGIIESGGIEFSGGLENEGIPDELGLYLRVTDSVDRGTPVTLNLGESNNKAFTYNGIDYYLRYDPIDWDE